MRHILPLIDDVTFIHVRVIIWKVDFLLHFEQLLPLFIYVRLDQAWFSSNRHSDDVELRRVRVAISFEIVYLSGSRLSNIGRLALSEYRRCVASGYFLHFTDRFVKSKKCNYHFNLPSIFSIYLRNGIKVFLLKRRHWKVSDPVSIIKTGIGSALHCCLFKIKLLETSYLGPINK